MQLVKLRGTVSAVASDGDTVVVGVGGDLTPVYRRSGRAFIRLPSGAGHDAMVMAEAAEGGMLFVRCGAGGVSHNPAETVAAGDAGLAVAAMLEFLQRT